MEYKGLEMRAEADMSTTFLGNVQNLNHTHCLVRYE